MSIVTMLIMLQLLNAFWQMPVLKRKKERKRVVVVTAAAVFCHQVTPTPTDGNPINSDFQNVLLLTAMLSSYKLTEGTDHL